MNSNASRERRRQRIALYEPEERAAARTSEPPEWQVRLAAFPDPWLFDSEKLLRELDRCRELVAAIPNTHDRHATHFQREIAVTALWNLRETLQYLLSITREGQREFGKKTPSPKPNLANLSPGGKRCSIKSGY